MSNYHCLNSSKMEIHQIPMGNVRVFRRYNLILNWYLPPYKDVYPLESTTTSMYWVFRYHAICMCCLLLCSHMQDITEQVLLALPNAMPGWPLMYFALPVVWRSNFSVVYWVICKMDQDLSQYLDSLSLLSYTLTTLLQITFPDFKHNW